MKGTIEKIKKRLRTRHKKNVEQKRKMEIIIKKKNLKLSRFLKCPVTKILKKILVHLLLHVQKALIDIWTKKWTRLLFLALCYNICRTALKQ